MATSAENVKTIIKWPNFMISVRDARQCTGWNPRDIYILVVVIIRPIPDPHLSSPAIIQCVETSWNHRQQRMAEPMCVVMRR